MFQALNGQRARAGILSAGLRIAGAALLLLAASMVADTVASVARLHSALPYFDEWDDLDLFKALVDGTAPLSALFSQHNEHRIFFPRLILFADDLFLGGLGLLNLATTFATQMVHAVLFLRLLGRSRVLPAAKAGVAAAVLMLLFSLRQEENFSWDYQVQFVGVFALATLTSILFCAALARAREGRPYRAALIGAVAAASVAAFTMANGLLCAAIMVLFAAVTRAPPRILVMASALLLGLGGAYFYGYEPIPGHTPLGFALRHPVTLLSYTSIYLGNFLNPDLQASRLLGLWGLAGLAAAAWRVLVLRDHEPTRLAMVGVMLFTAASALATGLGRLAFGVDQALSSRYAMGSAAFWCAFLIHGWSVAGVVSPRSRVWAAAVAVTAAVLTYGAIRSQALAKHDMEDRAAQQRLATDGLLLGVTDEGSFGAIEDPAGPLRDLAAFLKSRDLSIFSGRDARLIGRPVAEAGPLADPSSCHGSIDAVRAAPDLAAPNAARLSGRAWGRKHRDATDQLYVIDAADRIRGLATRLSPFDDASAWTGFVLSPAGASVRVLVRLSDGTLCDLGGATVSP